MTSAFLLIGIVVSIISIMYSCALLYKLLNKNNEEYREIRRIQGSLKNVIRGELGNVPSEIGDYRTACGLKWDKKLKKYVSGSALSSEGLRAAFPK